MNAPSSPVKKTAPENLLFRSHIEICRFLDVLAQEKCAISAPIKNHHPFTSHFLAVDPVSEHFVVAYCPHKETNSTVLKSSAVEFTAMHDGQHFSFEAKIPEETLFEGQPAIQFRLPTALLLHNRREHPRIPVSETTSLRCIADETGIIPFESHISDISHDGLGSLVYDPNIVLEKGSILKGSRIILPNGDSVIADLELRYIASTMLPDGTQTNRAGLRFIQKPDEIQKLISYFIQDLDKK